MATNAHNHLTKYAMMKQLPPVMGNPFMSLFYLYLLSNFFSLNLNSSTSLHILISLTFTIIMLPISMASQDNHFHIFQWHFIEINHSNFQAYSHGIFLLLFFFSLIILIATSFLLAHLCRRRGSAASPACPATILHWGKLEMEAMEHKSAVGGTNVECCICLSVLKEGGKVKVLPECEHAYHSECVEMWLSANPTCPLCRASLHKFMSNSAVINNNINSNNNV